MPKFLNCLALLLIAISLSTAQSKVGFELKLNRVNTENNGRLLGGGACCAYYEIIKEDDLITNTYSLGIVYKLNQRSLLKLHFGEHKNGRILDVRTYDDLGSSAFYTQVSSRYRFFQIAPSFLYRIMNKKVIVPIELCINVNLQTREQDVFFAGINEHNFDFEISSGLQYRASENFIIGLHGLYTRHMNEYQHHSVYGTFKPEQYGVEFSVLYELTNDRSEIIK